MREALTRDQSTIADFRSHLGYSLRRRGLIRRAIGDAGGAAADTQRALQLLNELPSRAPYEWFETACCHATHSFLAGQEGTGIPSESAPSHVEQAISLLRKSIDMGYRNPAGYRTEEALEPLRDREELQSLLMDL